MPDAIQPIVVQKFGGSSVADVQRITAVADIVARTKASGMNVVVVVSAMGKTTDELLSLAKAIHPNPPRRELDMLLTTGERVTMSLLSMALQRLGHDAISFTGSQSGIITNDRHFDARIIEIKPHRIEDELARNKIVIIAGYQGMSYKREITTLGRGGSDTTAVALTAALGAVRTEIYSDVDGVYSADPKHIKDATHLPEIGHEQMLELSLSGAKVLNPVAVEIAKNAGITIHARSTFNAENESLIKANAIMAKRAVSAQMGLVEVSGSRDVFPKVYTACVNKGLELYELTQSPKGFSFYFSSTLMPDHKALETELQALGCILVSGLARVSIIHNEHRGIDPSQLHLRPSWKLFAHPYRTSVVLDADAAEEFALNVHAL